MPARGERVALRRPTASRSTPASKSGSPPAARHIFLSEGRCIHCHVAIAGALIAKLDCEIGQISRSILVSEVLAHQYRNLGNLLGRPIAMVSLCSRECGESLALCMLCAFGIAVIMIKDYQ